MVTMIKGIPVELVVREQTGADALKRPIYAERIEVVENVLVGAPSSEDVTAALNLSGKRIAYTLAIPKGDEHVWTDTEVRFWGGRYRTVGEPTQGIDALIPLSWNKKVQVERYADEDSSEPCRPWWRWI